MEFDTYAFFSDCVFIYFLQLLYWINNFSFDYRCFLWNYFPNFFSYLQLCSKLILFCSYTRSYLILLVQEILAFCFTTVFQKTSDFLLSALNIIHVCALIRNSLLVFFVLNCICHTNIYFFVQYIIWNPYMFRLFHRLLFYCPPLPQKMRNITRNLGKSF